MTRYLTYKTLSVLSCLAVISPADQDPKTTLYVLNSPEWVNVAHVTWGEFKPAVLIFLTPAETRCEHNINISSPFKLNMLNLLAKVVTTWSFIQSTSPITVVNAFFEIWNSTSASSCVCPKMQHSFALSLPEAVFIVFYPLLQQADRHSSSDMLSAHKS